MAIPAMPAEASSGARFTPSVSRNCKPAISQIMASPALRVTLESVLTCARCPGEAVCRSATRIM